MQQPISCKLQRLLPAISSSGIGFSRSSLRCFHTSLMLQRKPGIIFKEQPSFKWAEKQAGMTDIPYTHEPLPQVRTGGRGPFGKIWLKHVSGGLKRPTFWVDALREGKNGEPYIEEVLYLHKNFWRRHLIALVANGDSKRWIIAGTDLKVGDLTTSHPRDIIPQIPIAYPKAGDAYPIGALPVGTMISCVEREPGAGAAVAIHGGTSAIYSRALPDNKALVVMPSKHEMIISHHCMVNVGQVSGGARPKYSSFNEKSRYGIKQRSGLFQKKGGRFGRKIKFYNLRYDHTQPYPVDYDISSRIYSWPGQEKWRKPLPRFVADYRDNPRFRWTSFSQVR